MKIKGIAIVLCAIFFQTAFAQEIVTTTGGTMDVYYNLATGEKTAVSNTNWDLAFEIKGFAGSILTNDATGIELYQSPYSVEDWSKLDTNGMASWSVRRNDHTSWSGGFNQNPASEFDLGWGQYDINTHAVSGDSVFVLKLADGSYKKMYINNLKSSKYTFTYADIDGSNETTKTLDAADFFGKNFGYFSFSTESTLDREPLKTDWDLLFTKYQSAIPIGGGKVLYYPVSGVKTNRGLEVSERSGVEVTDNDTSKLIWSYNSIEVGSDWKDFDGSAYVITEDLSYFVRSTQAEVWKIYFTKYEGGSAGTYTFMKELMSSSSVEELSVQEVSVYPNPTTMNGGFTFDSPSTIHSVELLDANGRLVPAQLEMNHLSLSEVAAGLYTLRITTETGISTYRVAIR